QLMTPHFTNNSSARDITVLHTELIILFSNTDYPLQSFTREGILLRTILNKQQVNFALYFTMDINNNYIISDNQDNNIKIFNRIGKLIANIGNKGQIKNPHGISLDLNNKLIICDEKNKYKLQAF
ncbi:hypothetical protein, partial [Salmonella sp. s54836]|uniref:hypothetical protein n=1 Tax=Salmonella sp. s54836 TaxID=3159673 RepID=UPI0039803649